MQQAEWCYHSPKLEAERLPPGPRGHEHRWYDLSQPLSQHFYGLVPPMDVALEVLLLGLVWSVLNMQRIPSLAGFLAMRVTFKNLILLTVFILVWCGLSFGFAATAKSRLSLSIEMASVVARSTLGALPGVLFVATSISGSFGWRELFCFWGASMIGLALIRLILRLAGNLLGPVLLPTRHCLIVGSGARAFRLSRALEESTDCRYHILGFVDRGGAYTHPDVASELLGPLERLGEILKDAVVDEALIALPIKSCYADIQRAICTCEEVGVHCRLPSDQFSYSIARPRVVGSAGSHVIALDVVRHDWTLRIKRAMDVAGAACGLILLAPAMAVIGLLIYVTSGGPVIFSQKRFGLNKRLFTMYKFRTMGRDAESRQQELEHHNEMSGPVFKIKDDPRITKLGGLLRKTSLDELPQLWNVLNGTMSLVGPRPLPLRDVSRFSDAWLMRRFSVKPGLTCLWQISGRNDVDFDRWIELDLRYIDNWSLWLDLRILLQTVGVVLRGKGAV